MNGSVPLATTPAAASTLCEPCSTEPEATPDDGGDVAGSAGGVLASGFGSAASVGLELGPGFDPGFPPVSGVGAWLRAGPDGRRRRAAALPVSLALQRVNVDLVTAAQPTALWGWLLPGPCRIVDGAAPFAIAICPAVLPLPYSFVLFDEAASWVSFAVLFDGFTPSLFAGSDSATTTAASTGADAAGAASASFFSCPGAFSDFPDDESAGTDTSAAAALPFAVRISISVTVACERRAREHGHTKYERKSRT